MRTIYKYHLFFEIFKKPEVFKLSIPVMSKLLDVGIDNSGFSCAWFEHDTKYLSQERRMEFEFLIVGTGQHFENHNFRHYKTFRDGALVIHIYIRKGNENNQ
jgi:hypothetical protein